MLEKILSSKGAKKLTTEEKKTIQGGGQGNCPPNQVYVHEKCWNKVPD
ncbi:hypothetical protein NLG42_06120 [Flavobacterium plurextorum]|nr:MULTISPECIES: hypothetical protein [Flavobacterium]UUW10378.1 hypothetical protein NLG42_06120 [Flavobacterium plurextorum]